MDANSNSKIQKKTFIERWLSDLNVEQIGWDTEFYKLNPRKIYITNLLLSFFPMALTGKNGYHIWAGYLRELIGCTVSRVALWKRMGKALRDCLQAILEETIKRKIHGQSLPGKNNQALFSPFGETYLQDSTIIPLPEELKPYYKGSVSMGKQKSSIRVQAIYGLSSGTFREFTLSSFTDNDQGASGGIIKLLKPGDLMIRDLGYYVLNVFWNVALMGAFFLSRYRFGTNIYDAHTDKQIQLGEALKGSVVDRNILLGAKEKLPCRLVAVKLPDHVAAERRRKAEKSRDKRVKHNKEYMELLDWAIFITNIGTQVWGPKEILQGYRIRWHIEIIFKGWKSHLNMVGLVSEAPNLNNS